MNPIWNKPETWEDYKNGMYKNRCDLDIVKKCLEMFKRNCYFEMKQTTFEYKYSSEVNLSKRVWNNNAWLGQATCNNLYGATISETTTAWSMLTKKEKNFANDIAEVVIEEWINENTK